MIEQSSDLPFALAVIGILVVAVMVFATAWGNNR